MRMGWEQARNAQSVVTIHFSGKDKKEHCSGSGCLV